MGMPVHHLGYTSVLGSDRHHEARTIPCSLGRMVTTRHVLFPVLRSFYRVLVRFISVIVKRVMVGCTLLGRYNNDRMAGRKKTLCAEVPNLRVYTRKDPSSIQSFTLNTREDGNTLRTMTITTLTPLRTRGLYAPHTQAISKV